ncbi:Stk1 family PASTA domain-containing Ser/Thr kinase [Jidongwangia harbinensis]|uniref:Stk1 family PASTA domain-containing Ser/Thr kinase n=1 Tax=Jidongwangia harbinensis TaxID=2878561 RepID=UPI001CD91A83|nr:Stk1 family PASTA domain-containing Ser/Thr kinase [Jidongwangia harbinensis]MCA2212794.1 Stk1 family PASTA domain-containing Ser/Thr kinase [Jidongwangia harbinensis]
MTAQARLLGGRYQVGELLGYGGMAEVHRGRDLRLGRDVAIKMLRTDLARDATFQERFRREAQNSAALNHPAIVAVYDTGEEVSAAGEKQPFIVMEFVNGRTLKEVLAAEQRIQPRRALEIIADICAALEFSHRHGIIHRDIKPGNVMITQNGQVKVMDFGIARALASGATTMTQTSAVIGTAQYLSPEQARGESVDARSDVYAAGCVLFELLVGHPPFVGDSPVSVAYQHVREDPRSPSSINREVPPDVDAIVLKALAKNPLNRYQSAQEMRADALRAVAGRPVMATPVMSEAETIAMSGPGSRQPMAATTITRPVSGGPPPPPPERKSSSWVLAVLAALGVLAVVALGVGLALSRGGDEEPTTPPVQTVAMPKITELTAEEARDRLGELKLTNVDAGEPVEDEDCPDPPTVAKQSPAPNTQIPIEQQVSYQLCRGPKLVRVPSDLEGSTEQAARQALEAVGLKVSVDPVDSDRPAGQVLEVEKAGEQVEPDETITVKTSRGNLVEVPDVSGRTEEAAKAILSERDFNVSVVGVQREDGVVGNVVDQNPAGGEKRKRGAKITITVIAEPDPDPDNTGDPDPTGTTTPPDGGAGSEGSIGSVLGG